MDTQWYVILRRARVLKGWSQARVGAAIGYSASWVSRMESGRILADPATVNRICDLLGVPTQDLDEGADVRRREALGLGLGLGAALALPATPAAATTPGPEAAVERALFALPDSPPLPRTTLAEALTRARAHFHAADYARLAHHLPGLIAGAQASRAHDIAARAHVLLAQLALKGYEGYAWVAADRARARAEQSGNPVVMAEADHAMAITMRRYGRYEASLTHLRTAAGRLGDQADQLAMRGSLLLTAAYTAAQTRSKGQALALMEEAEELAARPTLDAQRLYIPGVFGPAQASGFRISVHHALGEDEQALTHARGIDLRTLPNAERRARVCMDLTRVLLDLDEPVRAFRALRTLERHAPQEARRPKVRSLTNELLTANGEVPGLRVFAERIGLTA
ncbi:helix-turn-helix transcriptional regulator [Streptomyces sp. NPDC097619]|uniref:helix-turn-helix domain-containing protein n=1 Tax=Streptomyces sp. NPDC097619 TaxID=3157228 RepID=UPI0033284C10